MGRVGESVMRHKVEKSVAVGWKVFESCLQEFALSPEITLG